MAKRAPDPLGHAWALSVKHLRLDETCSRCELYQPRALMHVGHHGD